MIDCPKKGLYVFTCVCLYVCLFVCWITQKVMKGFWIIFWRGGALQRTNWLDFGGDSIWIPAAKRFLVHFKAETVPFLSLVWWLVCIFTAQFECIKYTKILAQLTCIKVEADAEMQKLAHSTVQGVFYSPRGLLPPTFVQHPWLPLLITPPNHWGVECCFYSSFVKYELNTGNNNSPPSDTRGLLPGLTSAQSSTPVAYPGFEVRVGIQGVPSGVWV